MEKSIGNKVNCSVFISGTGTNLNCIIKNSKKKIFPIKVCLVISNKSNAPGLNYARKNNIPIKVFNSSSMRSFEEKTLKELKLSINKKPFEPSVSFLKEKIRKYPPNYLHDSWKDFLYWDTELEP